MPKGKTTIIMQKAASVCLAIAALTFAACSSDDQNNGSSNGSAGEANSNKNTVTTESAVARIEFPKLKGNGSIVIVQRTNTMPDGINYAIEWDTAKKSQRWSSFRMYNNNFKGNAGRYNPETNPGNHRGEPQYPFDPQLPANYYPDRDYIYGSGFQHGHIIASEDRQLSKESNYQTFFLTNMQPQYGRFNGYEGAQQGIWLRMENKVRSWAPTSQNKGDTLYVCKGGTIDTINGKSGVLNKIQGKMIVPKYYFMAVLYGNSKGYRAIGLWAEHKNQWGTEDEFTDYVVTIDELEKLTGIDFFCNIPDAMERSVEDHVAYKAWGLSKPAKTKAKERK